MAIASGMYRDCLAGGILLLLNLVQSIEDPSFLTLGPIPVYCSLTLLFAFGAAMYGLAGDT